LTVLVIESHSIPTIFTATHNKFCVLRVWLDGAGWYHGLVINIKRIAAATAIATGLGLAGVGAASVAEAMPMAPMPDYHWCPGQWWDPGWGFKIGRASCRERV